MGASLTMVIHRATGRPFDPAGLAILLCGIAAAYSLDRVVDADDCHGPPWLTRSLTIVGVIASIGCLILLTQLPAATRLLAPLIAVVALAYPRLKKLPGAKTMLVAVVWTWSAIAFPFNDGSWMGWRCALVPIAWPLLLLIAAGSLLCDLKDAERDRTNAVASLPVLVGVTATATIAVALAVLGTGLAIIEHRPGLAVGGAGLTLVGLRPPLLAGDVVGPLLVDAILTLPGALIAAHLV